MADPVTQYLLKYAQPEIAAASSLESHNDIIVVPAYRETAHLIEGLKPAVAAGGLVIIVVNRGRGDLAALSDNRALLSELRARSSSVVRLFINVELLRLPIGELVLIDKTSPGNEQPERGGVGLARRIGLDLALALVAKSARSDRGSFWLHTTDADATLTNEYFSAAQSAHREAVALTYPYRHDYSCCEPAEASALAVYELSLRYYLLGLRSAGSPFAFSAIGSTMAIRADAYARVRGVPKRDAGEDFHLLAKLAKIGRIERPRVVPIRIRGNRQVRTPFGTAKSVEMIRRSDEQFEIYAPSTFDALAQWLGVLEKIAQTGDSKILDSLDDRALRECLGELGCERGIEAALGGGSQRAAQRRRRLHQFFDAKRTLRLVHRLRDHGRPNRPWLEAVQEASFLPTPEDETAPPSRRSEEQRWLESATAAEESGAEFSGIDI